MIRLKKYLFVTLLSTLLYHTNLQAQNGVAIGFELDPDPSAIVHIQPPLGDKGLLIPRVDRTQIGSPAEGLLVYDINDKGFYYYEGAWQPVGTPKGGIIMWTGITAPDGWALCDGTQGTPNLSGRFIVGYNPASASTPINAAAKEINYGAIGNKGGADLVKLTSAESGLPAHNHSINHGHSINDPGHIHRINNFGNEDVGDANKQASYNRNAGQFKNTENAKTGITVNSHSGNSGTKTAQNASVSHENRPPYYVLAFIMKL